MQLESRTTDRQTRIPKIIFLSSVICFFLGPTSVSLCLYSMYRFYSLYSFIYIDIQITPSIVFERQIIYHRFTIVTVSDLRKTGARNSEDFFKNILHIHVVMYVITKSTSFLTKIYFFICGSLFFVPHSTPLQYLIFYTFYLTDDFQFPDG